MAVVLRGGAEEGVGEEKLQRELEMADWKGRPLGGALARVHVCSGGAWSGE